MCISCESRLCEHLNESFLFSLWQVKFIVLLRYTDGSLHQMKLTVPLTENDMMIQEYHLVRMGYTGLPQIKYKISNCSVGWAIPAPIWATTRAAAGAVAMERAAPRTRGSTHCCAAWPRCRRATCETVSCLLCHFLSIFSQCTYSCRHDTWAHWARD